MKRGGRLKRSKGLARGAGLKRGGRLKSKGGGLKRTRLKARGAVSKRERRALERFRAVVVARAGGICQRCAEQRELEAHHLAPRGRNRGHPMLHDPGNGAALCARCHAEVHSSSKCADRDRWILPSSHLEALAQNGGTASA